MSSASEHCSREECGRPRPQQAARLRADRRKPVLLRFERCCARGRAHSKEVRLMLNIEM